METEAPYYTWRRTSGAAPDAVKAARPVLNGGREETCRKVTRLAPTQRRGGSDQTRHVCLKRTSIWPLITGLMLKSPPAGRYVQSHEIQTQHPHLQRLMMARKDGVDQIIKAFVTVVTLVALTGGFRVIKTTLNDLFGLTRGAGDTVRPA